MPASQSAMASPKLQAPVRRFEQYEAAVQAMAGYEAALRENALRMRSNGLTVTDQDQPAEVFCLLPVRPPRPPLALIGGMGPLAGAMAFRRACARFRDSRAVVLYQVCSMPDRSTVILGEDGPDTPLCRGMASRLAGAVRLAVGLAGTASQPAPCIIARKSAPYLWRLLEDDSPQTRTGTRVRSADDLPGGFNPGGAQVPVLPKDVGAGSGGRPHGPGVFGALPRSEEG